mgnify:CR=1 FL=1
MSEDTTLAPDGAPRSALDRLADFVIAIAATALFGLVVVQGWQVFARYVINDSPSWTEPVTLLLLSIAMSLGAAAGVHTRRHFGFFLLQDHMRPGVRKLVDLLIPLVIASIGAVIAWWGGVLLVELGSQESHATSSTVPLDPTPSSGLESMSPWTSKSCPCRRRRLWRCAG